MTLEERFKQLYQDLANIDVNQLELVYHQNVRFIDPITSHDGLDAVKHYYAQLLESVERCEFDIHAMLQTSQSHINDYDYLVEWTMRLRLKNNSCDINVDGVSLLKAEDDRFIYHRDYYDLGEMVYEHVPVLKQIIRYIKKKLNK